MSDVVFYLNSNNTNALLAWGTFDLLISDHGGALIKADEFIKKHEEKYIFSLLGYDLKNEIEQLSSSNKNISEFPDLILFVPKKVVEFDQDKIIYLQGYHEEEDQEILLQFTKKQKQEKTNNIVLTPEIPKAKYLEKLAKVKNYLQRGDIYEVTFCQNFVAKDVQIEPLSVYHQLNNKTLAPFSCFVKYNDQYLISGSPERFLKKDGDKLISQPIKGTAKRATDQKTDEINKNELLKSEKERAENVMIVDLVRNDLSKIATKNSVNVSELFGVYSFKTVHQLISTVECQIKDDMKFSNIMQALFPMGSMTGAPKISAMQIIEELEDFKRGIFSGSVGCIKPSFDFDFNVVIRSIIYNEKEKTISCPVGGAITIQSDAEAEYQECLLKVDAMKSVLNGN